VRAHAAAYTAGVVLSFVALAGVLVVLRAAGEAAGWGIQFTQPVFVAAMAWLMLAVGLNLSGVFAVGGPIGAGQSMAARGGHAGSFFTGALAVLVATPCTAPFMATAIGAALAMGAVGTLTIFAALGLGMALPYALLGAAPGLARLLPRPGVWMERFKQALAFPMYAAAGWLVWVLAEQAGPPAVLAVMLGGVLIGFGAWAWGLSQGTDARLGRIAGAAAVVAALALLPLVHGATPSAPRSTEAAGEAWSAARVAALRAEGRPVFVNLTAAWCITCKVNERVALATDGVQRAFADRNIAYLTGDWTRGDPEISALLRAHARDGVPLYLFYPAGGTTPLVLPQILTEGIVLQAITSPGAAS
jgi:thiol:disulfide interchange protein